eukprot:5037977-Amphidinium_carterae.1
MPLSSASAYFTRLLSYRLVQVHHPRHFHKEVSATSLRHSEEVEPAIQSSEQVLDCIGGPT